MFKKKLLGMALIICMIVSTVGCQSSDSNSGDDSSSENTSNSNVAQIAEIILASGTIDDGSFCQGAWEGIQQYAEENNLGTQYYIATEETTDAQLETIKLAVENGAEIIVAPGYNFETTIYQAQDIYPDIKFVLLDGEPHNDDYTDYKTGENVTCVLYAEQQAGFLAGYALVKEGLYNLGFMGGMAYPAVMRYGYGFIAGADYAAQEEGLSSGDVTIKYTYTGNFEATPDNQTLAASWYQGGTEVIFACGGSVGYSVMAAAEQTDAYVVGVDTDQYNDSETVITSAEKMLANSVYQMLTAWGNDAFEGGTTQTLDVTADGVGIAMETARFSNFTQENYDEIYNKLVNNTDGILDYIPDDTAADTADGVSTEIVVVEVDNN